SPSRAFFLNAGGSAVEDGTADLQTTSSFSASTVKGQFALGMDGIVPEALARNGTLQFDGTSNAILVEVVNDSASGVGGQQAQPLAGNYQVGGSGRITAQVSNNTGSLDVVMYAISGSQAYVLQNDPGSNTSGTIQ